jgi:peroxiredoxin
MVVPRRLSWIIMLFVGAGCALAPLVSPPASAQKMPSMPTREGWRVGDLAYDFTISDLEGKPHRLKDMRGKNVVHLVFWATWCMPCIEEIPHLRDAYDRFRDQGFEIYGVVVAMNQTKEGVRSFAERNKMPYPILWDGDLKVMNRYRVDMIPQNFLIGRDGVIQYAGAGLPAGYEDLLRTMLAGEPAPRAAAR